MTKELYEHNICQLINTMDVCCKNKLVLPSLILLYSGIDIMAWLSRDKAHFDSTQQDFTLWVDTYLMPGHGFTCKAKDLYAARCSILHSYTPESLLSRKGEAKKIFYSWGTAHRESLQHIIDVSSEKDKTIVLNVDALIDAFKEGVQRFDKALSEDRSLSLLIYARANKFFTNIPKEVVDNLS